VPKQPEESVFGGFPLPHRSETDLVSVDFGVLLSRVFDPKLGGNISSHIIPPILDQKSAKIIPKIDETQIC
jgi:hypothetical protein